MWGQKACAIRMEQQRPARGAEWQIAEFIRDHEVEFGQAFRDLPGLARGLCLLKGIDRFVGGEEADLAAVMLARTPMAVATWVLPVPGPPVRTRFPGPIRDLTAAQGSDGGLVDLSGGEVDAREVLPGRG